MSITIVKYATKPHQSASDFNLSVQYSQNVIYLPPTQHARFIWGILDPDPSKYFAYSLLVGLKLITIGPWTKVRFGNSMF